MSNKTAYVSVWPCGMRISRDEPAPAGMMKINITTMADFNMAVAEMFPDVPVSQVNFKFLFSAKNPELFTSDQRVLDLLKKLMEDS